MLWRLSLVVTAWVCLATWTSSTHAQIYRWDNGKLIPGTEAIKLGPGVDLTQIDNGRIPLEFGNFPGDLSRAKFKMNWLHNARFVGTDLRYANFHLALLDNANFTGANLTQAEILRSSLQFANFTGADLTGVWIDGGAGLQLTIFSGAIIQGIRISDTTITAKQLQSTGSYQRGDLTGISLYYPSFRSSNFQGQNLTDALLMDGDFVEANLTEANLTRVRAGQSRFTNTDLRRANLTDAWLKNSDLSQANLSGALLTRTDLSAVNLTGANLSGASLLDTQLKGATLSNTNLDGADLRGVAWDGPGPTTSLTDTILPDGRVSLIVDNQQTFAVRDDDGVTMANPNFVPRRSPIPITVTQQMTVAPGGHVQLLLDADRWDSLIQFQPGIPVQLAGTLELTFAHDTRLAQQTGRTIKVFDWTGVSPEGTFAVQSQPGLAWDTAKLYTTGEVTLLGISSDLDGDKDVDSGDLLAFMEHWTGNAPLSADKTWRDGDSDGDGDVDSADMLVLLSQWTGAAATATRLASVPEPSGVVLLGAVGASVFMVAARNRRFPSTTSGHRSIPASTPPSDFTSCRPSGDRLSDGA